MSDPVVGRASPFKARSPFRGIRAPFRGIGVWGRYPARTNSIRNNTMAGAAAGTPGTLPTNWSFVASGLSATVVDVGVVDGLPYIDVQISGTTGATSSNLFFDTITGIAATNGQTFTLSFYTQLIGGSFTNVTSRSVNANAYNASSGFISGGVTSGTVTNSPIGQATLVRTSRPLTGANAALAYMRPSIAFAHSSGVAVDFTLRIAAPQFELGGGATSPIRTSGSEASRVADTLAGAY